MMLKDIWCRVLWAVMFEPHIMFKWLYLAAVSDVDQWQLEIRRGITSDAPLVNTTRSVFSSSGVYIRLKYDCQRSAFKATFTYFVPTNSYNSELWFSETLSVSLSAFVTLGGGVTLHHEMRHFAPPAMLRYRPKMKPWVGQVDFEILAVAKYLLCCLYIL